MSFDKQDLMYLLQVEGEERQILFEKSGNLRNHLLGNQVFLRGLIEYSNVCQKDCLYCGIRKSNKNQKRYLLHDEEVIECAKFAYEHHYGSIVIQSGERQDTAFVSKISKLIEQVKKISNGELGITLSLGEQTPAVYQEWFSAGAHRYLLRIETSNAELYSKIHPQNDLHHFETRMQSLHDIRQAGFQLGTGVMIGLPFQTLEHLADDLLFLQQLDVDMVGMGPYIEHKNTPLYQYKDQLLPRKERLELTFKMIALLRLMMKDINIAATTALQAIDPMGREKAVKIGANIIMPNITPGIVRKNYKLYEDKPCTDETPGECTECLDARIQMIGSKIAYHQWGDAPHFQNRILITK